MKTATDIPGNGRTVEKTTVTRIIPTDFTQEQKSTDFWDYIEALPPTWGSPPDRHLLYVYRRLSDTGPNPQIEKCSGSLYMPDGSTVLLNDREEIEHAIGQKHGGGTYRLILKNGGQRVSEGRIVAEGPPKVPPPMPAGPIPAVQPATPGDPGDVAKTAMQLVGNRDAEAVNVAISALRGASDVVQRFSQPNGNAGGGMNDMILQAIIQRAFQPQADPMDTITKMLGVFQSLLSVMNPGGAQSPIVQKIIDGALERFVNPPPSGPATSTGAELVRSLPQIAGYAGEALRDLRLAREAELKTVQIMSAQRPAQLPPTNGTVQTVAPGQPVRPITQATQITNPVTTGAQTVPGEPSVEWIESRVVDIIANKPAEEAADEALSYIDNSSSMMFEQIMSVIKAHGEVGLMHIFQTRPVLREATKDMLRLQEFVKAVLKLVAESEASPTPSVDTSSKPN